MEGFGYGVLGQRTSFKIEQNKAGSYHLLDGTRGNGIHTLDARNSSVPWLYEEWERSRFTGWEVVSESKMFQDKAAVDAHVNTAKVYDYFKKNI